MWITIDPNNGLSLTRQLYLQLKERILNGSLIPGEKLPSTRSLACELSISRNTVMEAYDQLIAEGYLEGHHGSGTVVSTQIPKQFKITKHTSSNSSSKDNREYVVDFRSGVPDLEHFPRKEWAKLYHDLCYQLPASSYRYNSPAGVYELRKAISLYLYRTRGIDCSPEQIMIVSGSTQGLSLTAKLLYQKNREVIVEDPIHTGLMRVITSLGYHITGVPVDNQGMQTDLLTPSDQIAFIYTTPSHQYPMGGILPLQRRIALIDYATDHNCYIIEDDYDSEFRFEGQPINSLYELKPDRVIYIGSFSKILAPAIRLGFLLLPQELINEFKTLKQYSDVHTEAISQYVLAGYMESGGLERHIWKMKKLYHKKREHLLLELKEHFDEKYDITGQAAGLHMVVQFQHVTFTEELLERIQAARIKIYPVAEYSINHKSEHQNEIIMGYAHLTFDEITKGVRMLKEVIG